MLSALQMIFSSPLFWGIALPALAALLGLFYKSSTDKAAMVAKREQELAVGVYHVFHLMQDFSGLEPQLKWLSDTAGLLKLVDGALLGAGLRPLEPGEVPALSAKVAAQASLLKQAALTTAKALGASVVAPKPSPA